MLAFKNPITPVRNRRFLFATKLLSDTYLFARLPSVAIQTVGDLRGPVQLE